MTENTTIDASLSAIRDLSPADRELVASALAESHRHVDDDMGDDPEARHKAYRALAMLVRRMPASGEVE